MKLSFYLCLILYLMIGCTKRSPTTGVSSDSDLIAQAKAYFQDSVSKQFIPGPSSNPRLGSAKDIDWPRAVVMSSSQGEMVIAPVQFSKRLLLSCSFNRNVAFDVSDITQVIFYKDSEGRFICEQITTLPDSSSTGSASFRGFIQSETWGGTPIRAFKYNADGSVLKSVLTTDTAQPTIPSGVSPAGFLIIDAVLDGCNYSADDPDDPIYWSETVGSTVVYVEDGGGAGGPSPHDYVSAATGGGGSGSVVSPLTVEVSSGPNPIGNIADYLKCFTNVGGSDHTYTVTVCINQPTPGSREPWSFSDGIDGTTNASNPVNTGHAFLIFSETYGGTQIVRNVGFYPTTFVLPGSSSSPGQLHDNESTSYNISLSVTVDNGQFFNMLNYVSARNNATYNLYSFNCTTFVINTLLSGGTILPMTQGSWPGGTGNNPGDLGEDIRNMTLSSSMSRNTTFSYHPNLGICQ